MMRIMLAVTLLLCATPAMAQDARPRPGETVRVRMRVPAELDPSLRLFTPAAQTHRATLLALTADSIFLEMDAPVARLLFISIGHWTVEDGLALTQLETLEVERSRFRAPTPRRIGMALLGGAAAGFLISRLDWQCPDAPCPNASRNVGLLTGGLVSIVLIWPWGSEWVDVPLHDQP